MTVQLELFSRVDPGDREQARSALERDLERRMGVPVRLVVTDNRTRMLSAEPRGGGYSVRLHHMFLGADDRVVGSLASYLRTGHRRSGAIVDAFIRDSRHLVRAGRRGGRPPAVETAGRVRDLAPVFAELNATYFEGGLDCACGWGRGRVARPRRRTRTRSIKLGSYDAEARVIRIHPVLDGEWVPGWFLGSIVHHEMCHARLHALAGSRAGRLHDRRFRALEARYAHHDRSAAWLERHLERLLRERDRMAPR